METPPRKLNGYDVIGILPAVAGEDIYAVLVHRPNDRHARYVTAMWHPRMGSEWHQGHYIKDPSLAIEDLVRRAGLVSQ